MSRNIIQTDRCRRNFLKHASLGSAGVLLAPILNRLAAAADGQEAPPRFLFVVEGNGLPPEMVHPAGDIPYVPRSDRDTATVQSLAHHDLPPSLQPVSGFKDRMTVIQGLSGRMCAGGHSSDHGALGAYHANNGRNVRGPTIDAVLGKVHPGIFPNVVLGIAADPAAAVIFNCSASRQDRSLPTICKPDVAFSRMFGSVARGHERASFVAQRNLLDFMQADVKRVRRQLGGIERQKLDAYLHAYESIANTSRRLVDARETLADVVPVADDKYRSTVETDRLDAHFEMAAAAMIGGVTNVLTIASGVGFPHFSITFGGLGMDQSKHNIGHSYRKDRNGQGWKDAERIRGFHFELIARFMRQLDAVPEGNGTMLDNTLVVYLSDAAEDHHSSCYEWPFVLLGNCNGRISTSGQYVSYPDYGRGGHRTIGALYNTLLHAAGEPRDDFGRDDPDIDQAMNRGPLSELLG